MDGDEERRLLGRYTLVCTSVTTIVRGFKTPYIVSLYAL